MRPRLLMRGILGCWLRAWETTQSTADVSNARRGQAAALIIGVALNLFLLSAVARAEVPSKPVEGEAKYSADSQLPVKLLGTWTPLGRGYMAIGDLTFETQTLSWGFCEKAPYRVLREDGETYLVQFLLVAPACRIGGISSFLIVEPAERGIEVSICRDPGEFQKPKGDRQCSHGVLARQSKN